MMKHPISTLDAPAAIGTYSQAIKTQHAVYLSGQIPLDPVTMNLVEGDIRAQIIQVFNNLKAVAIAAQGGLDTVVRLTVYLTDISHLALVNEIMGDYFSAPYPARTSFAVAALPKGALVEVDAIMAVG